MDPWFHLGPPLYWHDGDWQWKPWPADAPFHRHWLDQRVLPGDEPQAVPMGDLMVHAVSWSPGCWGSPWTTSRPDWDCVNGMRG